MKKLLCLFVIALSLVLLAGCDYEYKDDLQKAMDNFDNKNYTLNVYAQSNGTHTFKDEVEEDELFFQVTINVDSKRELYHFRVDGVDSYEYRVKNKDVVDLYAYKDNEWVYFESVDANIPSSLYKVVDPSAICHDDFIEVSEGKWVPQTDKYNQMYYDYIAENMSKNSEQDDSKKYHFFVEGFTINVVDGVIANIQFSLKEDLKTLEGRYIYVTHYVLEFSEIGSTNVERLNVSKEVAE